MNKKSPVWAIYFFPKYFLSVSYADEIFANSVAEPERSGWCFLASARYRTPTSRHDAVIGKSKVFNAFITGPGRVVFGGILSNVLRPFIKSLRNFK